MNEIAHPASPYQLLPPGSALPPGQGGVAVRLWVPSELERDYGPPIIGVGGKPAAYGWGEAVLVLPAGDHILEVQYGEPVRSEFLTVRPGEVIAFEHCPEDNLEAPRLGSGHRQRVKTKPMTVPMIFISLAACGVYAVGIFLLAGRTSPAVGALAPLGGAIVFAVAVRVWLRAHWRAKRRQ